MNISDAARDLVERSTTRQGVPFVVDDAATLERVAALIDAPAVPGAARTAGRSAA
jgi:hypothetical protein